jgi:hypothetical protein
MKTALWIMLVACLAWSPAQASEDMEIVKDAMLFEVKEFGLAGFSGGVGWRHHFSERVALRPSLDFYISSWERDPAPGEPRSTSDDWSLGLNVAVERHFETSASLSPYLGVGAKAERRERVRETDLIAVPGSTQEAKHITTTYGALSFVGFQWRFHDRLSLGGEYRVALTHSGTRSERKAPGEERVEKDSGVSFRLYSSRAYLSVAL